MTKYNRNTNTEPPNVLAELSDGVAEAVGGSVLSASAKQMTLLRSLGRDRDTGMTFEDFTAMVDSWVAAGVATRTFISQQITAFRECPRRESPDPGIYFNVEDDAIYMAVKNKTGTRTYAKRLFKSKSGFEWVFESGLINKIHNTSIVERMTTDKAAHWSALRGRCLVCLHIATGLHTECGKQV